MDFNILVVNLYTNITEPDKFRQTVSLKANKVLGELGEQVKTALESKLDNFKQTISPKATKVLQELGE